MATLKVIRLEHYPQDEPTGYAIGFVVTCNNNRDFYIDTVVPFSDASTDEEAITVAKNNLMEAIQTRVAELEQKSPLIGQELSI